MKKNVLLFSALAFSLASGYHAYAQPAAGTVIFEDKFDDGPTADPTKRYTNNFARVGTNSFIFANPAMDYPLPVPAGAWTTVSAQWQTTPKDLENNHYAVVAPANIYESVSPGYSPFYNSWPSLIASGVDADGNATGGVLVVNAGTTPGILYEREVMLERGKYYKLTYDLWVENTPVRLKTNLLSSDGVVGLGTSLGAPNGGGASHTWLPQTQYFFLPAIPCEDNVYTFNLQNHQLANSGNDFAVDNILLVELTDPDEIAVAAAASNTVDAPCAESAELPVAVDDTYHYTFPTEAVRFPLLSNDSKGDGTPLFTHNGSWAPETNPDNAKLFDFEFIVPAGEGHTGNEDVTIDGVNLEKGSTLTIQGEGTWKFSYNNNWDEVNGVPGNTFYVEFIPQEGFIGNPSPIQYIVREYTTVENAENQIGLTSAPATVTVTFELPVNPVAVDDIQLTPNGTGPDEGKYIVNPFANDNIDGAPISVTDYPAVIEVSHPLNEGAIYTHNPSAPLPEIVVPGEGVWSYTAGVGFIFTPDEGFTATPSPLYYRFQEPTEGVWSNWAGIGLGPDGDEVLPVSLINFYAVISGQSVLLNWATGHEANNKGFEIERSGNGSDWSTIGFVATKAVDGNSQHEIQYSYTDDAPLSGNNIYRLKQEDINGQSLYSPVVKVVMSHINGLGIAPNPAADHINISGLKGGESIYVLNVTGRLVGEYTASGSQHTIHVNNLSNGVYYVQVVDGQTKQAYKIVVSK